MSDQCQKYADSFLTVYRDELEHIREVRGMRARSDAKKSEIADQPHSVTTVKDEAQTSVDELDKVLQASKLISKDDPTPRQLYDLQTAALGANLFGVAISGGGIRSATFALGVLQGLSLVRLIERVDYLSTVSGGGYIGSWLMAWLRRDSVSKVQDQMPPLRYAQRTPQDNVAEAIPGDEPNELRHLRFFSNFLAPRPGLFSIDGWVLIAIFLRNLMLNQVAMVLFGLSWFVALRAVLEFYAFAHTLDGSYDRVLSALALFGLLVTFIVTAVFGLRFRDRKDRWSPIADDPLCTPNAAIVWPWLAASILVTILFAAHDASKWFRRDFGELLFGLVGVYAIGQSLIGWVTSESKNTSQWRAAVAGFFGGAVGGAIAFCLLRLAISCAAPTSQTSVVVATIFTFGLPIIFLSFLLGHNIQIGLAGPSLSEHQREWWSSFNARFLRTIAYWLLAAGITVYAPWLLAQMLEELNEGQRTGLSWKTISAGVAWIVSTIGGVRAAFSQSSGGLNRRASMLDVVVQVFAAAFFASVFCMIAAGATWLTYDLYAVLSDRYNEWSFAAQADNLLHNLDEPKPAIPLSFLPGRLCIPQSYFGLLVATLAGLLAWFSACWIRWIGVNRFSLHRMYSNRLARCYLGATNPHRQPDRLSGFDPSDDFHLGLLQRQAMPNECVDKVPLGPLHLINAALNCQTSKGDVSEGARARPHRDADLALLERKAFPFVFSPLWCGSPQTGFARTTEYADNISLGTAVAVSGAAVSSNMGFHSNPLVTALLTVFNVRLGAWFGHPRSQETRGDGDPGSARLLWNEFTGDLSLSNKYVYVSDGGHFENLGVYELIRRRCRFILIIDSGADPEFKRENLAHLVRKVRIDFGVRIEIDVSQTRRGANGLCPSHVAVGKICYGDVHVKPEPSERQPNNAAKKKDDRDYNDPEFNDANHDGIILYIKPGLTGDEPNDLLSFQSFNPAFPDESTLDQFYSESQFESYRGLGLHSVLQLLEAVNFDEGDDNGDHNECVQTPNENICQQGARIPLGTPATGEFFAHRSLRRIFKSIHDHWLRRPDGFEENYVGQNNAYIEIVRRLRDDNRLVCLAYELFELKPDTKDLPEYVTGKRGPAETLAESMMAREIITMFESVFVSLKLDKNQMHPVHAGWMSLFENWMARPTIGDTWVNIRGDYTPVFKSHFDLLFCKTIAQRDRMRTIMAGA